MMNYGFYLARTPPGSSFNSLKNSFAKVLHEQNNCTPKSKGTDCTQGGLFAAPTGFGSLPSSQPVRQLLEENVYNHSSEAAETGLDEVLPFTVSRGTYMLDLGTGGSWLCRVAGGLSF